MADKPLAANTIRSRFDHVRAVIRAAVADRAIPFDVTASVTLPRLRKAEAAMTIPTTAEVGRGDAAGVGPSRNRRRRGHPATQVSAVSGLCTCLTAWCRCSPSMCACVFPAMTPTGECSRTAEVCRCTRTQPEPVEQNSHHGRGPHAQRGGPHAHRGAHCGPSAVTAG
jgi:hypothetical protein